MGVCNGKCYVHGTMDGELVVTRNQQGVDLENFVLV
jgi:hypothetical protein